MVLPAVPDHPLLMSDKHASDAFAFSQIYQELAIQKRATLIISGSQSQIALSVPPACPPLAHSRVNTRAKFCLSPRLLELACDNSWIFKVFWKKLTKEYGNVKQQGTTSTKIFSRVYSDRREGCPLCKALFWKLRDEKQNVNSISEYS